MFDRPTKHDPHPYLLARWLLVVAFMVFLIVIVGGITRLTESGLSIVDWQPLRGIVPPLTTTDWEVEFAAYRTIPQYLTVNQGMTLDEFKQIYFWEYIHRLIARSIGLVLAGVLIHFWWMRRIPQGYGRRLILILALGGLQGLIGWWMVVSGLANRTEVSHLRLATHMIAAMLIFTVLLWTAFNLLNLSDGIEQRAKLRALPLVLLGALAFQIIYGALTAGLRAGYAFSSWPLMGGEFFPTGGWGTDDLKGALLWNPIVVQFIHRWWAWVVAALAVWLAASIRDRSPRTAITIVALVALQIALGISTLLTGVWLPLAAAHQAVAVLLLASVTRGGHLLGSPPSPRVAPLVSDPSVSTVS